MEEPVWMRRVLEICDCVLKNCEPDSFFYRRYYQQKPNSSYFKYELFLWSEMNDLAEPEWHKIKQKIVGPLARDDTRKLRYKYCKSIEDGLEILGKNQWEELRDRLIPLLEDKGLFLLFSDKEFECAWGNVSSALIQSETDTLDDPTWEKIKPHIFQFVRFMHRLKERWPDLVWVEALNAMGQIAYIEHCHWKLYNAQGVSDILRKLISLFREKCLYCCKWQDVFNEAVTVGLEDNSDKLEWEKLKGQLTPLLFQKIIPEFKDKFKKNMVRHRDKVFFDVMNEVHAYNLLKSLGCLELEFIDLIKNQKTPDLRADLNGNKILCEVKTINLSDIEKITNATEYMRTTRSDESSVLPEGFFRKLLCSLKEAQEQMSSYCCQYSIDSARKIIYIYLNFDDRWHTYIDYYFKQIQYFCNYNKENLLNIEIIFESRAFLVNEKSYLAIFSGGFWELLKEPYNILSMICPRTDPNNCLHDNFQKEMFSDRFFISFVELCSAASFYLDWRAKNQKKYNKHIRKTVKMIFSALRHHESSLAQ